MGKKLDAAINALADEVPNGHLLLSTGGHDLLVEATALIKALKKELKKALEEELRRSKASGDPEQPSEWETIAEARAHGRFCRRRLR